MRLLVSGCTETMARQPASARGLLGHLTSPRARNRLDSLLTDGLPWAVDNGAFSGFDSRRFRELLARIKDVPGCLFVVVPDVVRHARATLEDFARWAPEVAAAGHPLAFVAQDGAEETEIPWDDFDVWFVGGSDEWRYSPRCLRLVLEARQRGKRVHFGRVNSFVRVQLAWDLGADTVDGTGFSWFGDHYIPSYVAWVRQLERQRMLFEGSVCGLSYG